MRGILRTILTLGLLLLAAGCGTIPRHAAGQPRFRFPDDTLAFANETVFAYKDGDIVSDRDIGRDPTAPRFSRHCFVMARAVVQFWKYARFEPQSPALPDAELTRRIERITHLSVWGPPWPAARRVVVPGYATLHELSARKTRLLEDHLGSGLATYFRFGNWSMSFPPSHKHQARTDQQLREWLARGYPVVVWLCNFPSVNINHVITVYDCQVAGDRVRYRVYDPNYADRPRVLEYDPATREFRYEPTFYFVGGVAKARIIYQSPLM